MFEIIESIIDQYYDYKRPQIKDLSLLDSSPDLKVIAVRWKVGDRVVMVKSIEVDGKKIITKLD
jgi:hypothetical protein